MQFIIDIWPALAATIQFTAMAGTAAHAMLTKSDVRSAAGWVGFILFVPFLGWLVYLLFGVNRIQRRARELRGVRRGKALPAPVPVARGSLPAEQEEQRKELESFARFGQKVLAESFEPGNMVDVLTNGDEAYPAMIEAIDRAARSIALSTYIFNNDKAGLLFVEALTRAVGRGVRVRLLIDGVGSWYSQPSLIPLLRERGINYARFLHSFMPWQMPYLNMRNHQKILVVDGEHGFTGGMNIAVGNLVGQNPDKPILDYHFKVEGPVVAQLMRTFAHEWEFTTGEILSGPDWFPPLAHKGDLVARALPAGPDLGLNPIRWTLLGALSEARQSIRVVTPYFLPDTTLATNLSLAAMRGVDVDIILPETNNLFFVDWAATPSLLWFIEAGCRVWKTEGHFEHSKLMTVDGIWSTVGSANWDGRSLRLNFELNLECYGSSFAQRLDRIIDAKIATARPVTLADIAGRPFPEKLRDAAVRLASPYL
ncbi:phospholipase D-like domain-containing protein [Parvibaculum sp.]|uniref:phospholipase D-like domain-containing protein n=1 Tax=Parvibaculum sp. TaxID=2024848 RepID=UPI002CD70061|nr:phospholipase D-like domain-containing protein [Parvibaculum sp.]HUD51688.1 phospholipase D-like domain-containing protein [Parvibaculum sp.]